MEERKEEEGRKVISEKERKDNYRHTVKQRRDQRGVKEENEGVMGARRKEGRGIEPERCGLTGNSAEVEVVSDDLLVVVVH